MVLADATVQILSKEVHALIGISGQLRQKSIHDFPFLHQSIVAQVMLITPGTEPEGEGKNWGNIGYDHHHRCYHFIAILKSSSSPGYVDSAWLCTRGWRN